MILILVNSYPLFHYRILHVCLVLFIFSNTVLKFSLSSSILLLCSVNIFMIIILFYQVDCIALLCLVLYVRFCLISFFFGTYFSVSSLCQFSIYFYVLGGLVICPNLRNVVLYRKCFLGPQKHDAFLVTRAI